MHRTGYRPIQALPYRLVRWHRLALFTTGALLTLTGVVWLVVHYLLGAGAGALPHPLEAWCLRLHGAGVFGGLFVLGLVAAAHVPQGWRLSRHRHRAGQRRSGLALCALAGSLALSGYALYYLASEANRPALGWAHAALGLAMAAVLAVHRRRRAFSAPRAPR